MRRILARLPVLPSLPSGRFASRLVLDMLLPPRCPVTGELVGENGTISPAYWRRLHFIDHASCACCGAPFAVPITNPMVCARCLKDPPPYARARAALRYDDASATMILRFKHTDSTFFTPLFTRWMIQAGQDVLDQSDLVLPVPLHRWRLLKRRYNQAALLSQAVARACGLPHDPFLLRRKKATPSQGKRSTAERHENIKKAFMLAPGGAEKIRGKTLLLVDDVYTSGATVKECAALLLTQGAKSVNVLTLARAGLAQ